MTNRDKFKAGIVRFIAFENVCRKCWKTNCDRVHAIGCFKEWLDLEAEDEKPLPCPFCGGTDIVMQDVGGFELACQGCGFHTPAYMESEKLISEYQRVARAVMAAKESEAKE